jgi:hypothetical protein
MDATNRQSSYPFRFWRARFGFYPVSSLSDEMAPPDILRLCHVPAAQVFASMGVFSSFPTVDLRSARINTGTIISFAEGAPAQIIGPVSPAQAGKAALGSVHRSDDPQRE